MGLKELKSYFFPMPANRPATAFYRERRHSEAPRGMMPTSCHDGSGTILSGLMCCTAHFFRPSAATAFRPAPTSHLSPAETLSAERKKSRRLGAISGSNGWLALRRLRQSHLFGGGYLDMLRSNSSEQLCLSAAGGANCRSKNLCTVWPSGLDMRARSRARRQSCGTVAQ